MPPMRRPSAPDHHLIERDGGGHILELHSVVSRVGPGGSYDASKSAFWSQTNSLRVELKPRGIEVTGLHVGYVDTDPASRIDAHKSTPQRVAAQALDGVVSSAYEVLADDTSRQVKAGLSGELAALYPQIAQ